MGLRKEMQGSQKLPLEGVLEGSEESRSGESLRGVTVQEGGLRGPYKIFQGAQLIGSGDRSLGPR